MKRWISLLSAALLALGTGAAEGAQQQQLVNTAELKVEVRTPFDHYAAVGYLPLEVTIQNKTASPGEWVVEMEHARGRFMESSAARREKIAVEAQGQRTVRILAPLAPAYAPLMVNVLGPNLDGDTRASINVGAVPGEAVAAFSKATAGTVWADLRDKPTGSGSSYASRSISLIDVAELPEDWRGLVGLQGLWLSRGELDGLRAEQRTALQQWVQRGGALWVMGAEERPAGFAQEGFGEVRFSAETVVNPKLAGTAVDDLKSADDSAGDMSISSGHWGAAGNLKPTRPNATGFTLFLVLFAGLVGPVNFLYFAPAARRSRLFWTTPLISVGASVILLALIVLQDGFGGGGVRTAVVYLASEGKMATTLQEQASRTGLLLGSSFRIAEPAVLMPAGRNTFGFSGRGARSDFSNDGEYFTGDWFNSRSRNLQWVETLMPTRAEVQVVNAAEAASGAGPVVVSSVDGALLDFRYVDGSGQIWYAAKVPTGQRMTLERGGGLPRLAEYGASTRLHNALERVKQRRNHFFALAEKPLGVLETLTSIRWENRAVVVCGPAKL